MQLIEDEEQDDKQLRLKEEMPDWRAEVLAQSAASFQSQHKNWCRWFASQSAT